MSVEEDREESPAEGGSGAGNIGLETHGDAGGEVGGGESEEPTNQISMPGGGGGDNGEGGGVPTQGIYGKEEVSTLKGIFNLYDAENTGTIGINELEGILYKVGHSQGETISYTDKQPAQL